MKVAPVVAVALLMASPLAIVALDAMGVGPAFEASPPEWESGYSWTWDVTGRGRVVGEGFGVVRYESETLTADATRRAEVLNTTLEQDGRPVDLLLEAFRVDQVRHGDTVVYDGGSDAEAPDDGEDFAEAFFCITPCGTFLATYDTDANPAFGAHAFDMLGSDKVALFDFPLTRGKTWTLVSAEDDGILFEIEAKAADNEYVDVPGHGPMAAVRIDAALTEASKAAIKRLVQDEANQEGISVDLDFDLKASYWYAPEVQNLVKLDLDGFITARASGYGAAGGGRVDFHFDQILRSFSLDAKPERSVEEAQALAGVTAAARGKAPVVSPQAFDFQVGASSLSVPAGSHGPVTFGLVTGADAARADEAAQTGHAAAPEGSQVRWTHTTPAMHGTGHEIGEGERAEVRFDEPGLHIVRAEVYDLQGRLMGTDQVVIEAYTHERFLLDATPTLPGVRHDVDDLTIAPGAHMASVLVEADAAARGILHIAGAEGQVERVELLGDAQQVPFDDLSPGERLVSWEDEVRAGAVAFTVEVRYDRATGGALDGRAAGGGGWAPFALLDRLFGGA